MGDYFARASFIIKLNEEDTNRIVMMHVVTLTKHPACWKLNDLTLMKFQEPRKINRAR